MQLWWLHAPTTLLAFISSKCTCWDFSCSLSQMSCSSCLNKWFEWLRFIFLLCSIKVLRFREQPPEPRAEPRVGSSSLFSGLAHSGDTWCVHVVCSMWPVFLWGCWIFPVVLRGKIFSLFAFFFSIYLFQNDIKGKVGQLEEWCFKAWRWGWMLHVLECK